MKQIIQISLDASRDNFNFKTEFGGQKFHVRRFGTDGDLDEASDLLLGWNKKADAIGLGGVKFAYGGKPRVKLNKDIRKLLDLAAQLHTPVTTGDTLRSVAHEWSLRNIHFQLGNNYFTNARVFFFSGVVSHSIARVMAEYTNNLVFADLLLENSAPKFIHTIKDLELYAGYIRDAMRWIACKRLIADAGPVRAIADNLMRKAVREAHILVVPHYHFHAYLDHYTFEELEKKIVISSTVYDDRVVYLKERGVDVIIDTTPKILEQVVGVSVLEALLFATLNIDQDQGSEDDLLEIISDLKMPPRIVYPAGKPRRVKRFAFVVHPPSQEFLKRLKPIEVVSDIAPGMMNTVEKVMAYSPPFVYSKVSGIVSKTGVEAEGWLIALGETPEQMQAHPPGFTTKRILEAAKMAQKLGAQVMGLGMLPKAMVETGREVADHAVLPITTGNSYTASATLWAVAEVVRQMGLCKQSRGKLLHAKAMVIGATGGVGRICSHLLATAFKEVILVGRNIAKLLTLQESIHKMAPKVKLQVSTRADRYLDKMDVVVAASTGARHVLDIMQVKPGCVIADITLPMVFSKEDTAKRPDVVVIRSGEIRLPGENVEMEDIGLPPNVAYAGLAETIILALEGHFAVFNTGGPPQWDKVREIYRLGLKHGMELAAVSGVDGVFSDQDLQRVRDLALKELNKG